MQPAPGIRPTAGAFYRALSLILAALGLVLCGPAAAQAQQDGVAPSPAGQEGEPQAGSVAPTDDPLTFLDSVTVSATLRPAPVRETPGMVSVIDSRTIEERLVRDFADLVKYEPGVYIENNVTRLGLNGFNIRGIGGNRVMTQVDGVQTSEQFDFGPFNVHQVGLDVDALKTVEIVRSANSALYGSDALGGVVSLFTKDPADYLGNRSFHLGARTIWDGRSDVISGNLALAAGTERLQGSLFASVHRGNEIRNQGAVETTDDTRTAPNPQDIAGTQLLAKLVFTPSPGNMLRTTAEVYDTRVETEWFSDRGLLDFGRFQYLTADSDAVDTQERKRLSIDHTLIDRGLDQLSWRLYGQFNDTAQVIDRERMTFGFGPPFPSLRHGTLDFEQVGYGTSLQGQQWSGDPEQGMLITAGASYKSDYFDILRDRTETHGITQQPVPTSLNLPDQVLPGEHRLGSRRLSAGRAPVRPLLLRARRALRPLRARRQPGRSGLHREPEPHRRRLLRRGRLSQARRGGEPDGRADRARAILGRIPGAALQRHQHRVHQPPRRLYDPAQSRPAGRDQQERRGGRAGRVRPGQPGAHRLLEPLRRLHRQHLPGPEPGDAAAGVPEPEPRRGRDRGYRAARRGLPDRQRDAALELRPHQRSRDLRGHGGSPARRGDAARGNRAERRVLGLRYVRPSGRWGGELSVRVVEAYRYGSEEQFAPEAYEVVDLVGFVSLAEPLTFRLGLLNLTDSKHFEWWNVRGRPANDPVIDRYSSPGVSAVASLGYEW